MRELVTQREDRQDAGAIARGGQDYPTKASVMRLVGILGYASRPEPVRGNRRRRYNAPHNWFRERRV